MKNISTGQRRLAAILGLSLAGFVSLAVQNRTGLAMFFAGSLLAFAQCGALLASDELRRLFGPSGREDATRKKTVVPPWLRTLGAIVPLVLLAAVWSWFFLIVGDLPPQETLSWLDGILAVVPLLVSILLANWWRLFEDDVADGALIGAFLRADRVIFGILAGGAALFIWTGVSISLPVRIAFILLWAYALVSFAVGAVGFVLSLRSGNDAQFAMAGRLFGGSTLVDQLSAHTGLSLHSLWSLGYLRKKLPLTALAVAGIIWYATGFVEVGPGQQAAVYHFGRLSAHNITGPGFHMVPPWPLGRVEVFNTDRIQAQEVGFQPNQSKDFLWAQSHSTDEMSLVTGGGKELAAINLIVKWRIGDLFSYLTNYADPERQLIAQSYRLLVQETASSDLDTLISKRRHDLSERVMNGLRDFCNKNALGLQVEDVVVKSIHPPIEIGSVYQSVVSAQIDKATARLAAQGDADAAIAGAQSDGKRMLDDAKAESELKNADAKSEATSYLASREAYHSSPACYEFTKTMAALTQALAGRKLYLLGDGVAPERLILSNGQSQLTGADGAALDSTLYQDGQNGSAGAASTAPSAASGQAAGSPASTERK